MKTEPPAVKQKNSTAPYLFLFFLSFYFLTNAGGYRIGDASFMRVIAKHIADHGQIGIADSNPDRKIGLDASEAWIQGTDKRFYIKWGIGQPLIEAPFFFVSRMARSLFGNGNNPAAGRVLEMLFLFVCPSAVSAAGVALFFLLCRCLGYEIRTSLILGLAYGLLTMAWPYSKSMMSETTLNTAILGSIYAMFSYIERGRRRYLFLSGFCCGFAILVKTVAAVLAPLVAIYLLVIAARRSTAAARDLVFCFLFPVLLFFGIQLAYNELRYGSWFAFGYGMGRDAFGFCTPLYVGLWGLFLSPGKSIFLYNPILVLGFIGLKRFFSERRLASLFLLAFCSLFVLIHAKWWAWAGDWAWGPRFLLVVMPYLLLPCGMVIENWPRISPLAKTAVAVVVGMSLAVQILGVFVHPYSFIYARTEALNHLVGQGLMHWGAYSREYIENALVNFSPVFSHIVGNFWLFKHMIFSYDFWVDVPWKVLADAPLTSMHMAIGNRVVPDWWPIALPLQFPGTSIWLWPLAVSNGLLTAIFGLRLFRLLRATKE